LPELLLALWSEAALSRDPLLSAGDELSFEGRGEGDGCGAACGCCAAGAVELLLTSVAALLSTRAPKLSVVRDWSERADFGGVDGKDTLTARSDVTLNTGGLSR
jgi:hypothetical protein